MRKLTWISVLLGVVIAHGYCLADCCNAVPGPGITGIMVGGMYGCPWGAGSVTVGVGDTVSIWVDELGDIDIINDPYPVWDGVHIENWTIPGGYETYGGYVWYTPGTYVCSCLLVDEHTFANDPDRWVYFTVIVKFEIYVDAVYSTDGVRTGGANGGTIGMDLRWIGNASPEITSTETQSLHPPDVTSEWWMKEDLSTACNPWRRAKYRWNTPNGHHNAPFEVKSVITVYPPAPAGPTSRTATTNVTLANLAFASTCPPVLKNNPGGASDTTVNGVLTDSYVLNLDVQRAETTITIWPLVRPDICYAIRSHALTLYPTCNFSWTWDGKGSGGTPCAKGIYTYTVDANQSYYDWLFPSEGSHGDSDSAKSSSLQIHTVSLTPGTYDHVNDRRPFSLSYSLFAFEPPLWAKIDRYDPDLAKDQTLDGTTSITSVNTVNNYLPLEREGTWSYAINASDTGHFDQKTHTPKLALQNGALYDRVLPVVEQSSPDPALSPHARDSAANYGNEWTASDEWCTGHSKIEGRLWVMTFADIIKGDDPNEIAWETDWTFDRPLSNALPRVWPNDLWSICVSPRNDESSHTSSTWISPGFVGRPIPESNDEWGDRTITLSATGYVTTQGPTQAELQTFYPATGTGHPETGGSAWCCTNLWEAIRTWKIPLVASLTPNWYYYYWQTLTSTNLTCNYADMDDVVVTLDPGKTRYDSEAASWYLPGSDHIHVSDDGTPGGSGALFPPFYQSDTSPYYWQCGRPFPHAANECTAYSDLTPAYIDLFYELAAHEFTHLWVFDSFAHDISMDELMDNCHGPNPCDMEDCDHGYGPNDDPDGDCLPNEWETNHHLDPRNSDTTGHSLGGDDEEAVCDMVARYKTGNEDKDWSNPGWNVGQDGAPPILYYRLVVGYVNGETDWSALPPIPDYPGPPPPPPPPLPLSINAQALASAAGQPDTSTSSGTASGVAGPNEADQLMAARDQMIRDTRKMGIARDTSNMDLLAMALVNDNYMVRRSAALALGRIGSEAGLSMLASAAQNAGRSQGLVEPAIKVAEARIRSANVAGAGRLEAFAQALGMTLNDLIKVSKVVQATPRARDLPSGPEELAVQTASEILAEIQASGVDVSPIASQFAFSKSQMTRIQLAALPANQRIKSALDQISKLPAVTSEDYAIGQMVLDMGPAAVSMIVQRLNQAKHNPSAMGFGHELMLYILGASGDSSALPIVQELAQSSNEQIRHYAGIAAGWLETGRVVPRLGRIE